MSGGVVMCDLSRHSRSRRKISYHEGGHAFVARNLGVDVTEVNISPTDGRLGNTRIYSTTRVAKQSGGDQAALARSLYVDLMMALAGGIAQEIAGYLIKGDGGLTGDMNATISCARQIARIEAGLPMAPPGPAQPLKPSDPLYTATVAILERASAETVAVLRANWWSVERIAGALRKRNQLTQAELDHIIAHGQRERQHGTEGVSHGQSTLKALR
jgi:hypothetical protein